MTKHAGFVRSDKFFSKQIHSRDTDNYKVVRRGQLAYATIHLDEGSIGLLSDFDVALISPMYTVFEHTDDIVGEFLYALLKSAPMLSLYKKIGEGTVNRRKSIGFSKLGKLEILLPPIGEQRKIAAILSSVDEAIEKTQAVIDQVQVVKKGLMQELLTRGLPGRHKKFKQTEIGEIPSSWEVVKLGDVCDVFNGRAAKTGGSKLRVFKTKHVYDGPLRLDRPEYVPDDLAGKVPASTHLQPGDVLTPNMAHGTIGRIAYAERVEPNWTVDGQIMVIRSREPETYHPRVVYEVLSSHRGRRALLDLEKGGAFDTLRGQTHIYPRDVAMISIPVIPVEQQGMIAATADSMDQYVVVLESRVGALKLVKQALMSVLLTGELRVTP